MVITVDIYRQVRLMHLDGVSQRQISRILNISRNTVKKYCTGEVLPSERKKYERTAAVLTSEVRDFVQHCFELDSLEGAKKQYHTARRIFDRLVSEKNFTGGESTIRRYVNEIKGKSKEAFVPLVFQPGDALQIDWGEAKIWLDGKRITVNLFCARLCYSEAPFVRAYRRQNSESFLDALVHTMEYFGGTARRVIFDNAKVAVKDGFGSNAVTQESYAMLAAHYGFKPVFCNVASGNEKGLVEGLVGYSRRNFCVPIPRVQTMQEFNTLLEKGCRDYQIHTVRGKSASVGTLFHKEAEKLYPLPKYAFDPAKRTTAKVTSFSTVRYDSNTYSVPVEFCGKTASLKVFPEKIEIFISGDKIAEHQRCLERNRNIYELAHYLPLLKKKGRAILQAQPVVDTVPAYFLDWLASKECNPSELVTLLKNSLEIGYDAVMRGETPLSPAPAPEIADTVTVPDVDLKQYDSIGIVQKGAVA